MPTHPHSQRMTRLHAWLRRDEWPVFAEAAAIAAVLLAVAVVATIDWLTVVAAIGVLFFGGTAVASAAWRRLGFEND